MNSRSTFTDWEPDDAHSASLVQRFRRSMVIDYERWHDGVGYELGLLKLASPRERIEIESIIISHGIGDWRDVEALAALDSPRARLALRLAAQTGRPSIRLAVLRFAGFLLTTAEQSKLLVTALDQADLYQGLREALQLVETIHPPEVLMALHRGVCGRAGDIAPLFAGLLLYLHGKAHSTYDRDHLPFLNRFRTDDRFERRDLHHELCTRLGIEPPIFEVAGAGALEPRRPERSESIKG